MHTNFSFSWTTLRPGDSLPPRTHISTVFLVGFIDSDHIIAIQNERGWDLPGGHLLPHETLQQGLAREVFEEAGATFTEAYPCIVLSSPAYNKLVVGFVSRFCKIQENYQPIDDAIQRDVFSLEQMLDRYFGDKALISAILEAANQFIAPSEIEQEP